MKTREYFLEAARAFIRTFAMLGKGCYYLLKHLFTNYPNPTWFCICLAIVITAFVKIGQARVERDNASRENARLIMRLDSMEAAL